MLQGCWAPCFRLDSGHLELEEASIVIAIYTGVLHIVFGIYGIYIFFGGQTDTFFTPFFEFSRKDMNTLAVIFVAYCAAFFVVGAIGLRHGIKSKTRFFYLPWLWATFVEIAFIVLFGFFLVYRYYHNEWSFFAAIIFWSSAAYHFYLYLVVLSLYYDLKELQEPNFVVIYS